MANRTAADNIHDHLNPYFNSRVNPNWKAIVETIGQSDQNIADLIEAVRQQFFTATANGEYLNRLGANVNVVRPPVVGMDDPTLRTYIPVLAYSPKQVKTIISDLLNIFFFSNATTSNISSTQAQPYLLKDGWELTYTVDNEYTENIVFYASDFSNIAAATAEEIASAINRQAQKSFAVAVNNRILKEYQVQIFTNTIGSSGSLTTEGGRANIALQMPGTVVGAGSGPSTIWNITKIGDTMTFAYIGGSQIGLSNVQAGDLVVIDMPGNGGTFTVNSVDLSGNSFTFNNLLGTAGVFDHGADPGFYVRFQKPTTSVVWEQDTRAIVWEVNPGEIAIEMPSTPPVLRRSQIGAGHFNGLVDTMTAYNSNTSISINDASEWPSAGQFILDPFYQVQSHILTAIEDSTSVLDVDGRFDAVSQKYTYTSKSGNTINGISPPLPAAAGITEGAITSITRDNQDLVSVVTSTTHGMSVGSSVYVYGTTGVDFDGSWQVYSVDSPTNFSYLSVGPAGPGSGGTFRYERTGLAASGSNVYLTSALTNTKLLGPYLYDSTAPLVLSSYIADITNNINAGNIVLNLQVQTPNPIPNESGYLIFDYGLNTQEGPVRYLYKSSDSTIALDPSYVFKYDHVAGSSVVAIRRKGAVIMSGLGTEHALYITDPSAARVVLQSVIEKVRSVGMYLRYIVKFPEQYYASYDVYNPPSNIIV